MNKDIFMKDVDDFFLVAINFLKDKNITYINKEKELFRYFLNQVNESLDSIIINGIIVSREHLFVWYVTFSNVLENYLNGKEDKKYWEDIYDILINIFKDLFSSNKFFDHEKIKSHMSDNDVVNIFLNDEIATRYIFNISFLSLMVYLKINIFYITTEEMEFAKIYILNKMIESFKFDKIIKIII